MDLSFAPLYNFVAPIIGLSVWGSQQGYGSFLTLHFGEPSLRVKEWNSEKNGFRRLAYVEGQWTIWIYCCEWRFFSNGTFIAHSESSRDDIATAMAILNGQKATQVAVDPENGSSKFHFDLGAVLETKPTGAESDEEQWFIYAPNDCFAYRADGRFSVGPLDRTRDEEQWQAF